MFPYKYETADGDVEGYIDTRLDLLLLPLKGEIDKVNAYYDKWVTQTLHWNI